jgi:hypothetical protein
MCIQPAKTIGSSDKNIPAIKLIIKHPPAKKNKKKKRGIFQHNNVWGTTTPPH